MPAPPKGFSQLPTGEIKLGPDQLAEIQQVAPKKRRPVGLYVVLAALGVAGGAIAVPAVRAHLLRRHPTQLVSAAESPVVAPSTSAAQPLPSASWAADLAGSAPIASAPASAPPSSAPTVTRHKKNHNHGKQRH